MLNRLGNAEQILAVANAGGLIIPHRDIEQPLAVYPVQPVEAGLVEEKEQRSLFQLLFAALFQQKCVIAFPFLIIVDPAVLGIQREIVLLHSGQLFDQGRYMIPDGFVGAD